MGRLTFSRTMATEAHMAQEVAGEGGSVRLPVDRLGL